MVFIAKKSLTQSHKEFLLNFLLEIFKVLALTFKSVIQFEFIFCVFLCQINNYPKSICWELSFLHWIAFRSLSKIKWHKPKGFRLLNLYHYIYAYSYINTKLSWLLLFIVITPPTVILKYCLATPDPLNFHIHLMISLSISTKKKKKKVLLEQGWYWIYRSNRELALPWQYWVFNTWT